MQESGLTEDEEYAPCVEMITKYLKIGYKIDTDIKKLQDTTKLEKAAKSANLTEEQTEAAIEVCTDTIAIDLKN